MGRRLSRLRADELKDYLRVKQLNVSGKKAELVARVAEAEGFPMSI